MLTRLDAGAVHAFEQAQALHDLLLALALGFFGFGGQVSDQLVLRSISASRSGGLRRPCRPEDHVRSSRGNCGNRFRSAGELLQAGQLVFSVGEVFVSFFELFGLHSASALTLASSASASFS
jgi:hypothetical protein